MRFFCSGVAPEFLSVAAQNRKMPDVQRKNAANSRKKRFMRAD
jgi:hypothetical protein